MSDEEAEARILHNYINCLKSAYTSLRCKYRPDYRGPGHRQDAKWEMAARLIQELNLNPHAYVQYVFNIMTPNHSDVYTDMLLSPKMIRTFQAERPELDARARLFVSLQAEKVKRRLKSGSNLRDILLDEYNELSPVFRFAVAWSEGLMDIAVKYRMEAEMTLLYEPIYKELLGRWLPGELK